MATAWASTHLPQRPLRDAAGELGGGWSRAAEAEAFADRIEAGVERLAPGFRARIRRRHPQTPLDLEANDRNLVGGAINGVTAQLHRQAFFRPYPGRGDRRRRWRGLYLASASAHPGGGNAATAALRRERLAAARRLLGRG